MKINPHELSENGYVLLDQLEHQDIVPFVQTYIKKRTGYSILYYGSNFLTAGITVFLFVLNRKLLHQSIGESFTYFAYGLALAFTLVPLHEYIHVLAYRSQGAQQTSYDLNWKKFYFLAMADQFVANKKEFEIVALAPFVCITGISLMLLFLVPMNWALTVSGVLLMHTAMCSGDFGLLSYFQFHKDKQVVTYDDKAKGLSYFYGKEKTF